MVERFTGATEVYTIGKQLGKGGEGEVFELAGNDKTVLKHYTEPLTAAKIDKLRLMVSLNTAATEQYAAWPADLVRDNRNQVVGFTMRRLNGYVPLHMLFSPMDRKRLFPDKGYDFLVHVARNICSAFHTLHSLGLVIGDVNEGNLLVDRRGMVAFIDCDSFQLRDGDRYYLCEVGVPRYTPPELLTQASFDNVVRTANTDSFSLAILIFQLLFLGRHPFAGTNRTREDIDEETAIRQHLFAYSLTAVPKKLSAPANAYPITGLPTGLVQLFHRAFEHDQHRPSPAEWFRELDSSFKSMTHCPKSKLHVYPSHLTECPWCDFKERSNILYFIDEEYLSQIKAFQDIDNFVNGFKVEKIEPPAYDPPTARSFDLQPAAVNPKYKYDSIYFAICIAVVAAGGLYLMFEGGTYFIFALTGGIFSLVKLQPWRGRQTKELKRLIERVASTKYRVDAAQREYQYPPEIRAYDEQAQALLRSIAQYKDYPKEFQLRRNAIETSLYDRQLQAFLSHFAIRDHKIEQIGPGRKTALLAAGISTAADIDQLRSIKVQGIGDKFLQILFSWQRDMTTRFVYQPDRPTLRREFDRLAVDMEGYRQKLEAEIKAQHQNLLVLKMNAHTKLGILGKRLDQFHKDYHQAVIDLDYFRAVVNRAL